MSPEIQKSSSLFNFYTALKKDLGKTTQRFGADNTNCLLCGELSLSHDQIRTRATASCCISFTDDWVRNQPIVTSKEFWIKNNGAEWHVSQDGVLCYDVSLRWEDEMEDVLREHGSTAAIDFGAAYLLYHTRWLLYRHYYAFCNHITRWQDDWLIWKHGEAGKRQYLTLKRDEQRRI